MTDNAGPCRVCGNSITALIHVPPFGRRIVMGLADAQTHRWEKPETPLSIEPTENQKRETCAADLVGCLKAWDYTRAEADDILRRARKLVLRAETWANPLSGTGVIPKPGNPGGQHG